MVKGFDQSVAYERIELRIVGDETSRLLELLKGRADVLTVTPSRPLLAPLKRKNELELISAAGNGYSYLAFNMRLPELEDQRVREAIALAINREAIIKHKYLGLARPSAAMTPPDHWAHQGLRRPSPYNPRRAGALLDAAGWRTHPDLLEDAQDNQKKPILKLEMRTTPEKFGRALSLVLQQQLRQVGIDLELRINDWGTLYSQVKKETFNSSVWNGYPSYHPHCSIGSFILTPSPIKQVFALPQKTVPAALNPILKPAENATAAQVVFVAVMVGIEADTTTLASMRCWMQPVEKTTKTSRGFSTVKHNIS